MWYFSWILGLGLALAFAILNAMWFELHADDDARSHYGCRPPSFGLSDVLVNRVYGEKDVALREGLRLLFGIPRPGERHI